MNRIGIVVLVSVACSACAAESSERTPALWRTYENVLKGARYVVV